MDGFKNTVLSDQLKNILKDVAPKADALTPLEMAKAFLLRNYNLVVIEDLRICTKSGMVVGEIVEAEDCPEGHVHVKVKMYYEFVISQGDTKNDDKKPF